MTLPALWIDWDKRIVHAAEEIELAFRTVRVVNYLETERGVMFYLYPALGIGNVNIKKSVERISSGTRYTVINYETKPDLTLTLGGVL